MKKANISYLRNHLSEMVTCVKEGEPILILDRNTPVAELQPYRYADNGKGQAWLQELHRKGLVSLAENPEKPTRPTPVKPARPLSAVEAVLKDRSESW